jgi:beta-mannosidase
LRFKGVFYYCSVYLNEKFLGNNEGYFIPFEFDITDIVNFEKENILVVKVSCPRERDFYNKKMITGIFSDWDCKDPEAQPGGIWNDVEIIISKDAYFTEKEIEIIEINDKFAELIFSGKIFSSVSKDVKLNYKISPLNFQDKEFEIKLEIHLHSGENFVRSNIKITNPKLWWIRGYGEQNLYKIRGYIKENEILDEFEFNFGLRKIEMKDLNIYLNNRRVFLRGTNYGPADIRIANADLKLYKRDIELIKNANMNAIRVHVHIEKEEFYDLCDKEGILIWQDFPLHGDVQKEIERSAISQIKKMVKLLKNHPSIGIWCCHNEPFILPVTDPTAIPLPEAIKMLFSFFIYNWSKDFLDKKLKKAVLEEDSSRPVIHGSGLFGYFLGWFGGTDLHLYFGWYIGKMEYLPFILWITRKKVARFVTEFGAQSFPNLENFSKIQSGEIYQIDFQKLKKRNMLQLTLMEKKSAKIKDYESISSYINATQEYQSKLNKYYIETLRKLKYAPCGGIMQFMFADCSPGITWSIVDYWRSPKPSYEVVKNCFSPLYIMIDYPKEKYKSGSEFRTNLYIINDTNLEFHKAVASWEFITSKGYVLKKDKLEVRIKEDSIEKIANIQMKFPEINDKIKLRLRLEVGEKTSVENIYEFYVK